MVLGLGGVVVDRSFVIPDIPGWDTVQHAKAYSTQQGGIVATALATVAKLGVKAEFIGAIGDDDAGGFLVRKFIENHVSCARMKVFENRPSPCSICLVNQESGSRTIIHYKGVQFAPSLDMDIDLTGIKYLHLDGYWPETAIATAKKARKEGVTVFADPSTILIDYERLDEFLENIDYLIPGYHWGRGKTGLENPADICRKLYQKSMKAVIVTMGDKGSYLFDGNELDILPGFSVDVVDTTGAGDVFHGGFITAKAWGLDNKTSCIFANASGALKCQKVGGQAGIPKKKEVLDFLKQNGHDLTNKIK